MNKKLVFFFLGAMALVVVLGVGFLQYQSYLGRQFLDSAGMDEDDIYSEEPKEERDEFYVMSDAEISESNKAASMATAEIIEEANSSAEKIKAFGFGGMAEPEKDIFARVAEAQAKREKPEAKTINTAVVGYESGGMIIDDEEYETFLNEQGEEEPVRRITMLKAPVGYKLITSQADYDKFLKDKNTWGEYPKVDFKKNDIVILESKGALGDNIFQITSADKKGDTLNIEFRVNILGLKERSNSHTYAMPAKGVKKVELKQIL